MGFCGESCWGWTAKKRQVSRSKEGAKFHLGPAAFQLKERSRPPHWIRMERQIKTRGQIDSRWWFRINEFVGPKGLKQDAIIILIPVEDDSESSLSKPLNGIDNDFGFCSSMETHLNGIWEEQINNEEEGRRRRVEGWKGWKLWMWHAQRIQMTRPLSWWLRII